MEFTVDAAPCSADVKDEAALPFGLVLCPLGEGNGSDGERGGTTACTSTIPTRGADVGRCSACFAYASAACVWGPASWSCALCGRANAYLSASGARYALPASRAACPELAEGGVVDLPDGDGVEGGAEAAPPSSAGGGGLPATAVVGLIDLGNSHAAPAVAECARAALTAVAAALPPGARLGVAAASSQLTLFDPRACSDGASTARVVSLLDGDAGPPAPLEVGDALPAPAFLAPLPRAATGTAAALDAAVAEATHAAGGGSAVGGALQALLAYLAAGAAEVAAAGGGCGSDDDGEGGGTPPTPAPPPPSSAPAPPPLLGTRLMLFLGGPPNAGRGAISPSQPLDRPHAFWAAAGSAAAALGVVIDVFFLDGAGRGAAALALLTSATGGVLRVFNPDGRGGTGEDARLAGLARRLVSPSTRTALAGELRVRSSPGLRVARAYAGMDGSRADAQSDAITLPRIAPGEAVAFDVEHAPSRAGRCLDPSTPPAAQAAFRYWRLEGLGPHGGAPFIPVRRLRIVTAAFPSPPTPDPAAVHAGAAPAPILALLAHKAARAAAAEGGHGAQGLLRDWLVLLTAARAHVDGPADPEAAADARFRGCEGGGGEGPAAAALRALPRLVHGLHRSRLLGDDDPDGAALDAARLGWLPPLDLARALYPELTAWEGADAVVRAPGDEGGGGGPGLLLADPRPAPAAGGGGSQQPSDLPLPLLLPLTAAALACGPPLYCLDAHDALVVVCVEGGGGAFPPPRGSALRAAVDAARARRPTVAPRVAFVSGADAAAAALHPFLVDDVGEDGAPAPGGGGLAAFLAGVTEDARALLRDGAGV